MQINGLSSSVYQVYAEMARQRQLQGSAGTEEQDAAEAAAGENMHVAAAQAMDARQIQQAQEVAPSMEVGDRASQNGNDVTLDGARSAWQATDPRDLWRLLEANGGEGSAVAAADATSAPRASFLNQVLKTFSDVGASGTAASLDQANFTRYMTGLMQKAYGT